MQCIANRYYSKTKRLTAYILLFIQLLLPIFVTFSSVAKAAQDDVASNQMLETINGIDALMNNNSALKNSASEPASSLPATAASSWNIHTLPDNRSMMSVATINNNNKPSVDHRRALPTLGIKETSQAKQVESAEKQFVQGATQIAQGLANNNATEAAINYARNRGEGLLNQKISDWLNQYGKARVQISSNKTGDADLLLPLIDKPNSLLFSQIGIRANEQRSTTNLGLGYRQYQQNWMWGINSFYDYDIRGGNARFGLGGELWAYYLKLAVNGYFRLTDWHQSFLHEMRDYDERPANGFDLRAEGYLPSYPHLGAYAKYEQYFGDGVSLSHNPTAKDLKDNPSAVTFGLSYTPFPLLTLKTQVSQGDSNDSLIGMEFAYRFGIPLAAQLNPDNVDLMRSLAGNRYDFVDRNYNIVMQYRKQEILAISLPDSAMAEAAQTIAIKATVQKAKYGLNKILWSAPELLAKGGKINETSTTTIDLVLPAYDEDNQGSKAYTLSAVGVDNEGNKSKAAVMVIHVTQSKYGFAYFTLENPTPIPADGNQTYLAKVQLQNDKGIPLADKQVTFSVTGFSKRGSTLAVKNNGGNAGVVMLSEDGQRMGNPLTEITDAEGKIKIKIKSDLAGQGELIATMANGKKKAVAIQFIPDATTAKVRNVTLIDKKNSKVANGVDSFSYEAFVVDQFNNPLPNVDVTWSTNQQDKVTLLKDKSKTDATGRAIITLRSTLIAVDNVEVSAKYANTLEMTADRVVSFVADERTAKVSDVSLNGRATKKVADGKSSFTFSAQLVDGNGNPIKKSGLVVNWKHNKDPQKVLLSTATSPTNNNGIATVELISTTTPIDQVRVSANYAATASVEADKEVNFIAEEGIISVGTVELTDSVNEKVADGKQTFTFSAQLVDNKGQPVNEAGIEVDWFRDKDDVKLLQDTSKTNEHGIATVTLQSTTKAVDEVQVSASSGSLDEINANKKVSFIANESQAHIGSVLLNGEEDYKIADGNTSFTFTAQLIDNNNNAIKKSGLPINWTHNKGDLVKLADHSLTDENGITTVTLYSTTKAVDAVQVSASYAGTASQSADKTVSFIANKDLAKLGEVKLVGQETRKIADGKEKFIFTVQLFDVNDNPIKKSDLIVYWAHDKPGKAQLNPTSKTDKDGVATVELQSTTMAIDDIEVSAKFGNDDKKTAKDKVSFIANIATAEVRNVKLQGKIDRKVAHPSNNFVFTAALVDVNGNPIRKENLSINWSTNQGSNVRFKDNINISKTDADGFTSITLESNDVAVANVIVSAHYASSRPQPADKPVSFITVSFSRLIVNGHNFPTSAQFPTTGFRGAKFTIETQGAPASEFKWQSNQGWVSVDNGLVTFTENGTSKKVIITAKHETGGDPIEYTFNLNNWFIFSDEKKWDEAQRWCANNAGAMPTVAQLSQGKGKRAVGSLWSEWGKFSHYDIEDGYYWTSTEGIAGRFKVVKLDDGFSNKDSYTHDTEAVVCTKNL
ncbi:inverse autotransporter beta domain-containing protein [Arsenophonus nasoniae]|uniref:Inverse autotransporter beta domain-containing protein n=1 Tax=Arsenophonus nasoniae TaxID=638 RepID=A0AA95K128_9GAMM|nr:inverse autotransporter beta domain-containing protein [Arsenophonus nasoniae]WGL95476.1 inverse autotransporter beta domain-containing protein [Arsenophonus nasoniae]